MENQIFPIVTIDEYASKMGADKDIVTVTFLVKSELVGEDLETWFERGYDFVLDASVSEGELEPNKYLVFVEIERRSWTAQRICELIDDLETLTGLKPNDWTVKIGDEEYPCELDIMKQKMILNPAEYKMEVEEKVEDELNEMRIKAGLDYKEKTIEKDSYIKDIQAAAGL